VAPVRVELRSLEALSGEDVGRWRTLAARALEPNPYFEPEFAIPAARHLPADGVRLLVVLEDGSGEWAACLPVRRQARFRKLPGPVLATWLHRYAYLGTPLMAPGSAAQAWRSLLDHAGGAGLLCLEQLGEGGPVASALLEGLQAAGTRAFLYERLERAALVRRADAEYLNPELDSRRRRELRRQRRKLAEHLGAALTMRDRAGDPEAVEAFLSLEAAGWKGQAHTALLTEGHGDLLREAAPVFAAAGRLQLLSLEADDRVVAMKCNLLAGDAIYCFKIAYDEALSRFSPGVQLELDNIEVFHTTHGAARIDSCAAPDNQMINRLWRGRRAIATVLVPGRGAAGAVSQLAIRGMLRARTRLRRHP
jgi:CelD/BcsL family acetyltransferase involved in cellulose biosynthesis